MLGTLLGGVLIGSVVSGCVQKRKQEERSRQEAERQRRIVSRIMTSTYTAPQRVVTKTVVKKVQDPKLKLQVSFFDGFRALDNKLARMVREGYKGVSYLIKGLEVTRGNQSLIKALKNIRNYRNKLSHDKRQWKSFPAPTSSVMADLHYAQSWVNKNSSEAARITWKGKNAFGNPKGSHKR